MNSPTEPPDSTSSRAFEAEVLEAAEVLEK